MRDSGQRTARSERRPANHEPRTADSERGGHLRAAPLREGVPAPSEVEDYRRWMQQALQQVRLRIERACRRAGRSAEQVHLVAVGKRHPAWRLRVAWELGVRDFGENYVQELRAKQQALRDLSSIRWHLVGRLQRNKAKYVARLGCVVHSLDSVALAWELGKRARTAAVGPLPVFVQVNLSGEPQKAGCRPEELEDVLQAVAAQPSLRARGLMVLPADPEGDPERSRPYFRKLRELAERHGLRELSMGMSVDLEVAIEEGATWVRVGTALFGPRP